MKNGLSFNSAGRSRGVAVAEFQMPSKSGWASRLPRWPETKVGTTISAAASGNRK